MSYLYNEIESSIMASEDLEKKMDLVLSKLDHIERMLSIEESIPEEDELEAILDYIRRKKAGKLEFHRLEDVIDDI